MNSIFVKLAVTSEDGPWQNDSLSYNYDSLRCETGVGLNSTTISTYGYDDLSRLSGLNSIAGNFAYDYVNNSGLLNEIDFPNGAKNTFTYDGLERLTQVQSVTSGSVNIAKFAYTLDNRDIRTSLEKTFGTDPTRHIDYGYDTVNQLTSAVSTETPPAVNQSWTYDPMGNRMQYASTPGSNPTSTATYTSNRLNQIIGISTTTGSNTVESTFTYDADGNTSQVTSDDNSSKQYTYDDADRLSSIVHKNDQGINLSKSTYTYDGFSRLRIITKYAWDVGTSAWAQQSQKKFVYDGMQVIQERDGDDNVIANDIWDGNIGGLEARVVYDIDTPTNPPQKYFYHYDGSGNVTAITDDSQATVAIYDYDAYGNLISSNGTYASQNPWRFSTKYYDEGSGLYYYGYRFYSPGLGKWINRDPISEAGGLNVYAFVGNNPVNFGDAYGEYVVLDDGIVIVGGAVAGLAGQAVEDAIAGKVSPYESYAAAMVGGSVGAEATIYAGPIVGGAAGAAASNAYTQGLNNITAENKGFDGASFAADTALGAGMGALPIPDLKVPGITAGKGSYSAVAKRLTTQLNKRTIKNIAVKSGGKMVVSQIVKDGNRIVVESAIGAAKRPHHGPVSYGPYPYRLGGKC